MIGVLVKLNIKEGSEKDFEENMLKLVEATNSNEEGVFYYGLLKKDDPQTYQMIEIIYCNVYAVICTSDIWCSISRYTDRCSYRKRTQYLQ